MLYIVLKQSASKEIHVYCYSLCKCTLRDRSIDYKFLLSGPEFLVLFTDKGSGIYSLFMFKYFDETQLILTFLYTTALGNLATKGYHTPNMLAVAALLLKVGK